MDVPIAGKGDTTAQAYFAAPKGGPHPGLILIEEIWGVDKHIRDVCDRFCREGFAVLSPELLGETGVLEKISPQLFADMQDPEKRLEAQAKMREMMQPIFTKEFAAGAIAKLKGAIDYLLADKRTNGNIGVLGFCFGGTYSFQLAIHDARIKAAVPFYGQPPEPLDSVASISCPVLNFNGAKDERIMAKLPELEAAMKKYGKEYTSVVYPGAGHAFFNDTRPQAYNAQAARDSWERSLAFLKKNLI